MMLCAALVDQRMIPEFSLLVNNPIPPGVSNLKVWIEEAWKSGEYLHQSACRHVFILSSQVLTPMARNS